MSSAEAPVPFVAVLVLAGDGRRLGAPVPKAFVTLAGRPLWRHAAATLAATDGCAGLVLVAPADAVDALRTEVLDDLPAAVVVAGGSRRQDSVRIGLAAAPAGPDVVAIHDAARPLVTTELVAAAVRAAARTGAALAAAPARDTLKEVAAGRVTGTPDRSRLWHAQTPQCFRRALIERAHVEAERAGVEATDDALLVERLGEPVEVVEAGPWNLKVTVPEDLIAAEALLRERAGV